ncbi:MAG: hypothetical protein E6I50_10795 [Chloroflexi bacterium]|nr:MAG: hypothetical protein E6I50_10795 [Chloroflexota bacterium]
MTTPIKLILGAVATLLVGVGIAAQTGTVQVPRDTPNGGVGGVHQPAAAPAGTATSQPSPTPADTTVTVAAPPSGGEDGGGGGGHGHGHGHGHGGD